jgi:hypothetical protein
MMFTVLVVVFTEVSVMVVLSVSFTALAVSLQHVVLYWPFSSVTFCVPAIPLCDVPCTARST